jgi:Mg-chelatase subunit ChlD
MADLAGKGQGANLVLALAVVLLTLMLSSLGIDFGTYYVVQNQLQSALDAAALAGANHLAGGEAYAIQAATDIATRNEVMGQGLSATDLKFNNTKSTFQVSASLPFTPYVAGLFCGSQGCSNMQVAATARSIMAARDTVLVLDTSSSMDDLGGGRPMSDVKKAITSFLDMLVAMNNENQDRVALVTFNQTGQLEQSLTSQKQSANFKIIRDKINSIRLFSGTGWNTNYEAGLILAQEELARNGRPNADKSIIFLTDGMPNLPAPAEYYQYSRFEPYKKCTDIVHNAPAVRALCTRNSRGQLTCPTLPNPKITPDLIPSAATECALKYVQHMAKSIENRSDESEQIDMKANTIAFWDPAVKDNATEVFRSMLKDPSWTPDLLKTMAGDEGKQYAAKNYESQKILDIYNQIAKDVRVKLTQ